MTGEARLPDTSSLNDSHGDLREVEIQVLDAPRQDVSLAEVDASCLAKTVHLSSRKPQGCADSIRCQPRAGVSGRTVSLIRDFPCR